MKRFFHKIGHSIDDLTQRSKKVADAGRRRLVGGHFFGITVELLLGDELTDLGNCIVDRLA
jgi:hypothetical protein